MLKKNKAKKKNNCEEELKKLQEENQKNLEGWQRARADYQNLSKEMEELRKEYRIYGQEDILNDLIPILNNFDQAIISQNTIINDLKENIDNKDLLKKIDSWKIGVDYINKQFKDFFENIDLEEIKSIGEIFDPKYHDAIETVNDENYKNNEIIKEIKKGYLFKGKVLFPAKVVVNNLDKKSNS